jgi:glycerol-1-phosphate dehydrogenase [NAD(P)+]
LLDQPYREAPFAMLAADEAVLVAHSGGLMNGDIEVMRSLARTLVLSGFGMTLCGGSYPASQGEHLISHYIEMMRRGDQAESFHGEQIAVTSVAMARLQRHVLRSDTPPRLSPSRLSRHELVQQFGPIIGDGCWREVEPKCFDAVRSDELNHRLHAQWSELRTRIAAVTLAPEHLVATLAAAGAPTTAHQLGWSEHGFSQAVLHARGIRNRYTFLDLAADSGVDLLAVSMHRA